MGILNLKKIFFVNALLFSVCVSAQRYKYGHNRRNGQQNTISRQSQLSIDAFGNCYANNGNQLYGRCLRYYDCPSAVRAWQEYQIQPSTCYYTRYDNFICCPYARPPTASPAIPTNPYSPLDQFRNEEIEQRRVSVEECTAIYFPRSDRRKRHRGKRQAESYVGTISDIQEEVIEDVIRKQRQVFRPLVVGGRPTKNNEFPYMCALGWKTAESASNLESRLRVNYNCGCVLVAGRYVLTAAHCAYIGGESPLVVRLGGGNLDESRAEIINIKRIIKHPAYNKELSYDDIAVIELEKSSRGQPACLWSSASLPQQQLTAIGYGQTTFAGASSNSLLKVFLNVLTNQDCDEYYKPDESLRYGIGAGHICAGDPQRKMDTCQGDSGGPLLITTLRGGKKVPYVVGLTSFGEGCANGTPSVYTRIFNYIDWIESIVWK